MAVDNLETSMGALTLNVVREKGGKRKNGHIDAQDSLNTPQRPGVKEDVLKRMKNLIKSRETRPADLARHLNNAARDGQLVAAPRPPPAVHNHNPAAVAAVAAAVALPRGVHGLPPSSTARPPAIKLEPSPPPLPPPVWANNGSPQRPWHHRPCSLSFSGRPAEVIEPGPCSAALSTSSAEPWTSTGSGMVRGGYLDLLMEDQAPLALQTAAQHQQQEGSGLSAGAEAPALAQAPGSGPPRQREAKVQFVEEIIRRQFFEWDAAQPPLSCSPGGSSCSSSSCLQRNAPSVASSGTGPPGYEWLPPSTAAVAGSIDADDAAFDTGF